MQLSVVILNYNVRYFLEQCLDSVQRAVSGIDAEIIVVDNASLDDSCKMVRTRFPDVVLIENKHNSGFPKGNNIGVAIAKGQYICILNPDTVVAEDTFERVLAFAQSKTNLGIIGCKLIDGTGNFLPESKRGVPTPWVAFTKVAGLYKLSDIFGKYYASHLSENQSGKVEILVGAFMVMQRETYVEVGGFDENCFMYSDDIDLSYMVLQTGKSNYYFHETSVIHYKGESTVRDGLYMKRFREAMDFFYRKHFRVNILFTLAKKNKVADKKIPARYALASADEKMLQALQKQLDKPVERVDIPNLNTCAHPQTEIIFDSQNTDYRVIIEKITQFRDSGATFKIVHKASRFAIGSNSSNDRGEVIVLTDYR